MRLCDNNEWLELGLLDVFLNIYFLIPFHRFFDTNLST